MQRTLRAGIAALAMLLLPLIAADAQQPGPPECAQNAPVCGLKNACLAARDAAQPLYAGECRIPRSYN